MERSPSAFSLSAQSTEPRPPAIPPGVPASLLERGPDIAAAERAMAQANAQIGVAKAAFFPNVLLTATGGIESLTFTDWFTWPSRFWSVGPAVAVISLTLACEERQSSNISRSMTLPSPTTGRQR
jgi:outer membrane protein TolC